MNEKIQELAIKARIDLLPLAEEQVTEFAELIVKECTKVIAEKHRHNTEATLIKNVKRHFGI